MKGLELYQTISMGILQAAEAFDSVRLVNPFDHQGSSSCCIRFHSVIGLTGLQKVGGPIDTPDTPGSGIPDLYMYPSDHWFTNCQPIYLSPWSL